MGIWVWLTIGLLSLGTLFGVLVVVNGLSKFTVNDDFNERERY